MTELFEIISRIVTEKRVAKREAAIALSLEISYRTGWPVFVIEWQMRELERVGVAHVGRTAGPDYAIPRCHISKRLKGVMP